ncbi:hypothetical protein PENSUB_9276 [Penicillium subrubescens]|uniref:Pectinesterase catalytic domain-containing protein n=1 Tax=Penicillium subrubescens TaxID=1316194 RepID=A0A1Q5TD75_9EURO|nr:hypothetical protein PENSUB_9276 [Penicillium subrubescens]
MRIWSILYLAGLAAAAIDAPGTCSSTVYITKTTDGSSPTSAPAVTVAPDGSGQFTDIGDAVSYAQGKGIPTVTVLSGTYPAVTIESTPSVTIVGETNIKYDYTKNKVFVSSDITALTISANLEGLTVTNINFVNTGPSGSAAVLSGTNLGFYQCQFISHGGSGINANQALAVIANSYIEAPTDLIEGSPNIYIFDTVIVPTGSFAVIVYTEGPPSGGKSTVVIDRSRVIQKSGVDNNNVDLAAAAGPGAIVVYRDSALGGLIAPSGVKIDSDTQNDANLYGEYDNTGAGAYRNNEDARSGLVSELASSDLSSVTISAVVADGNSDTTWVDPAVLAAIESADVSSGSDSAPSDGNGASGTSNSSGNDGSGSPGDTSSDSASAEGNGSSGGGGLSGDTSSGSTSSGGNGLSGDTSSGSSSSLGNSSPDDGSSGDGSAGDPTDSGTSSESSSSGDTSSGSGLSGVSSSSASLGAPTPSTSNLSSGAPGADVGSTSSGQIVSSTPPSTPSSGTPGSGGSSTSPGASGADTGSDSAGQTTSSNQSSSSTGASGAEGTPSSTSPGQPTSSSPPSTSSSGTSGDGPTRTSAGQTASSIPSSIAPSDTSGSGGSTTSSTPSGADGSTSSSTSLDYIVYPEQRISERDLKSWWKQHVVWGFGG